MSSHSLLGQWQEEVKRHFPSLSGAQARVLGQWSYGIVLTNGCGITKVGHWLAKLFRCPAERIRQRLREWYFEASAKRGEKRRQVNVEECFGDLLTWIVQGWEGSRELVLAMDATTLGERFTVLSISVVIRGCAIPVAWHILVANEPGSWKPHWLRLLALLRGKIPPQWRVIVMTDRGLYAAWLFEAIQDNGWHPMMRVNESMGLRAEGEQDFRPIGERVQRRGREWTGRGEWSEEGERMTGTVLVRWEKGYEEKLAVVTDLEPKDAEVAWYQMRFWIEGGFKDQKRGGWRWEQTKMTDPARAGRLWLAIAVAMWWVVSVGCEEEAREELEALKKKQRKKRPVGRPRKQYQRPRAKEQSCMVRGQQTISVAQHSGQELPMGHVVSPAWPVHLYPVSKPSASWVKKRKRKEAKKRQLQGRKEKDKQNLQRKQNTEKPEVQAKGQKQRRHHSAARQAKAEQETIELEPNTPGLALPDVSDQHAVGLARGNATEVRARVPSDQRTSQPMAHQLLLFPTHWKAMQKPELPQAEIRPRRAAPLVRLCQGRLLPTRQPCVPKIPGNRSHELAQQAGP